MKTIREKLETLADAEGVVSYFDFIFEALYNPLEGYYTRTKKRVGRNAESDFFTAESLHQAFGPLVIDAICKFLGEKGEEPSEYRLVELGAEAGFSPLEGLADEFAGLELIGVHDRAELSGKCVVFANELLDAQSFDRFIFKSGEWRERAVELTENGYRELIKPDAVELDLPASIEGYELDYPSGANILLGDLVQQDWSGLLMLFDYGKFWEELLGETPQGTARTYFKHTQGSDLLETPGERDITHHICWDLVERVANSRGFEAAETLSQERFFMRHATRGIEQLMQGGDPRVLGQMKELLHPDMMGEKFQVFTAFRAE